ncbi:MAG: hypothetical protein U0441_13935 [Polyangiaceae bacterium]
MRLARGGACLSVAALVAACSGAGIAPGKSRNAAQKPAAAIAQKGPYESPARWLVHPYPPTITLDSLRLSHGGCLVLESNGQRWLTSPRREPPPEAVENEPEDMGGDPIDDGEPIDTSAMVMGSPETCSGNGLAAAERAPEPILGLVRWPGAYGVLGASGTIHVATSPIGPFVRRIAPPERLRAAKSTGGAVLAISDTGRLYRFTEEAGYKRVDLGDVHAMSLVTAPRGRAVVLAAPEALFSTTDAGVTFRREDAPSLGVQRLDRSASGKIIAEGLFAALAWDPRKDSPAFTKTDERISADPVALSVTTSQTPSPYALSSGRAALDGDRYVEIGNGEDGNWTIYRGKLDGPLHEVKGAVQIERNSPSSPIIAARGDLIAATALEWSDVGPTARVLLSHDAGSTFRLVTELGLEDQGAMGMTLAPDGTIFLTGFCIPATRSAADAIASDPPPDPDAPLGEPVCAAGPIVIPLGAAPQLSRVPDLDGRTEAPAISPDGRSAYALFTGRTDARTSLLVSHDGARTFAEVALDLDDDDRRIGLSVPQIASIHVGEDGTLGMDLDANGDVYGPVWVTTDADGKNEKVGDPPIDNPVLAGFGSRVIVIDGAHGDGDAEPFLSESLDGGATWQPAPWPGALHDSYARRGEIACGASGCVLSEQAVRIGWGVPADRAPPFEPPKPEPPKRALRTTIACEPRPGSKWTRVDNVEFGLPPDEGDASRGKAAWSLATADGVTGEWFSVSAPIPASAAEEPKIVTRRLLGPVPKGTRWAFSARPQIEGISLARVAIDPMSPTDDGAPWTDRRIRNLEVAWDNFEAGVTGHATIPDAGTYARYTIGASGDDRFSYLQMAMLSVSPGGMFVRAAGQNEAFFVEDGGKARAFRFPDLPTEVLSQTQLGGGDAVHVDGTFIANVDAYSQSSPLELLVLLRPPAKGSKPNEPWTPWAQLLAPGTVYQERRYTRRDWTYDDKHLAIWTMHTVPDVGYAIAWMRRVQADGTLSAPVRVPTPYDLDATPRACTPDEHRTLPRLRVNLERWGFTDLPGVRHAIVLHEDGGPKTERPPPAVEAEIEEEPMSAAPEEDDEETSPSIGDVALLTTGLVLRGRGSVVCLDAIVGSDRANRQRRAVIQGDLSHGWYFRKAARTPADAKKKTPEAVLASVRTPIEARPLTCRWSPDTPVPARILSASEQR